MKFGVRKPSLKKKLRARTTGRAKRRIKKAIDPTYGKKGIGWVKDPKKAAYNKVYNKTSIGCMIPLIISLLITVGLIYFLIIYHLFLSSVILDVNAK